MKRFFIILVAAVAFGWAGNASAQSCAASWSNGYTYCRVLTIPNGQIPGVLTNFPIPFCFNMTEGNGNSCPANNGINTDLKVVGSGGKIQNTVTFNGQTCPADINFYSNNSGTAALNWDCASYLGTSGALEVYVQMSVTTGANYVYMFYDQASVSTYQGGALGAAWDANYQAVLHVPDGTTLAFTDATGKQSTSNSSATAGVGQLDGGAAFNNTNHIVVSAAKILSGDLNFTVHEWVLSGAVSSAYAERGSSGNDIIRIDVGQSPCAHQITFSYQDDAGNLKQLCGTTTVDNSVWHLVDVVAAGSPATMTVYVDGAQDSTFVSTVTNTSTNATISSWMGQDKGDGAASFIGDIDQLELSSTNRSPNWITAEFNGQTAPSTWFSVSTSSTSKVFAPHTGGQLISAPLLPQVTPSAVYPPDAGYTLTAVASGANLQTAINAAACGTKLNLAHNGTFAAGATPYTLPNNSCTCHTDPTQRIIIQSDTFEANYTPGVRTDPSVQYTTVYPHISGSDVSFTFTANANGSSCWGFAGLDVTETTNNANAVFGVNTAAQSVANFSHDFAWWGCYVHGQFGLNILRDITFNGNFGAIVDSYISDAHYVGADSQGIESWDGLGGLLVQNNFIEGAAENFMSGGADPQAGVIPADRTFISNHFFKPLSWRQEDPTYQGILYPIKNLWESKNSQRTYLYGNVMEYVWDQGQTGLVMSLKSTNQSGGCNQCVTTDLTIVNNWLRHAAVAYLFADNSGTGVPNNQPVQRFNFHDNLYSDIDGLKWTQTGAASSKTISYGGIPIGGVFAPFDIWQNHETYSGDNDSLGIFFGGTGGVDKSYGIQFRNSILGNATSSYIGITGTALGSGGDSVITNFTPNGNFKNDCLYGTVSGTFTNPAFSGLQTPATPTLVFVTPGTDFHVNASSLCHLAASDGLDMGANINDVITATAGVVQTLANLHTVTNVSPSTFTHLGSTSITITGTNFVSGEARVLIGGAGPNVSISSNSCGVVQGSFTVTGVTDTTHFAYTGGCNVVTSSAITLSTNDLIAIQSTQTVNRYTPGNLCTSVSVVSPTSITCTTPAATGTVTNGPVSIFVSQWGIPVQFNGANYN